MGEFRSHPAALNSAHPLLHRPLPTVAAPAAASVPAMIVLSLILAFLVALVATDTSADGR